MASDEFGRWKSMASTLNAQIVSPEFADLDTSKRRKLLEQLETLMKV